MDYTVNEAINYLKKLQDIGLGDTLKVTLVFNITVSEVPSNNLNHICIIKNEE